MSFLFAGDDCEFIEVTDGKRGSFYWAHAVYVKTDKRVPSTPNSSVWKHPDRNGYIFNTGSENGWRIGAKDFLSTEEFDYKGKNCILL